MIEENLDVFLSDFGVEISVVGATPFSFIGIFNESSSPMDLGAEGRAITVMVKTSDTLTLNHGSELEIGAKTYSIVGIRPINDGKFTELDLKE